MDIAPPIDSLLSPQAIRDDFDCLIRHVSMLCPARQLNRQVFQFDLLQKLDQHGSLLKFPMSRYDFFLSVCRALEACKANHLATFDLYSYRGEELIQTVLKGNEDALEMSHRYWNRLRENASPTPAFHLFYHRGDYYTKFDFTCQGKEYASGLKLLSIDHRPVGDIVAVNQDSLLKFDFSAGKFYGGSNYRMIGDQFYLLDEEALDRNPVFSFSDQENREYSFQYEDVKENAVWNLPEMVPRQPVVEYFKYEKCLFLKIPAMAVSDREFYLAEIDKCREKQIDLVIFDIRGNGGGSDLLWQPILQHLCAKTLEWDGEQAILNNPLAIAAESRYRPFYEDPADGLKWEVVEDNIIRKVPFLNDQEFRVKKIRQTLIPSGKSLKLNVPFFILAENIYSSAGNFVAFARNFDFLTSIGPRNPISLGELPDPYFLVLPNSKIIVSVEIALDLFHARTAEDVLHTEMDVNLEPSFRERLLYFKSSHYAWEQNGERRLNSGDPFINKALQLYRQGCTK